MRPATAQELVEAQLYLDVLLYGNAFWKLDTGGHKIRVRPEDVRIVRGRPQELGAEAGDFLEVREGRR